MKSNISENTPLFRQHNSHSPEEILAAGGTTAFGLKTGKNNETLITAILESLVPEPFTDNEWDNFLDQLKRDK